MVGIDDIDILVADTPVPEQVRQAQGISHRLHFLSPFGLRRAHPSGINGTLEGVNSLTPVEHPAQFIAEGVFEKVVGQKRRPQQAPQLHASFIDRVTPRG